MAASGRNAVKVAAEFGIRPPLLYRWARPKRQTNLSGNESKSGRSVEELKAEIRRFRAESPSAVLAFGYPPSGSGLRARAVDEIPNNARARTSMDARRP